MLRCEWSRLVYARECGRVKVKDVRMQGPPGHTTAILLVEDDPTEVRLLQEALQEA